MAKAPEPVAPNPVGNAAKAAVAAPLGIEDMTAPVTAKAPVMVAPKAVATLCGNRVEDR